MALIDQQTEERCRCPSDYAKELVRTIERPGRLFTPFISRLLLSIVTASVLVLTAMKQINVIFGITLVIMTVIFYIIYGSLTGDNKAGSLPYATYPIAPHLGLDGVELQNRSI